MPTPTKNNPAPDHAVLKRIAETADALEKWLGENAGTNADWPVELRADEEDAAATLSGKLQALAVALAPYRRGHTAGTSTMKTEDILEELTRATEQIAELKTALKDANEWCRAAAAIAERQGHTTNWKGFLASISESLDRQRLALSPAPKAPPAGFHLDMSKCEYQ
jgi:hypothetical protein